MPIKPIKSAEKAVSLKAKLVELRQEVFWCCRPKASSVNKGLGQTHLEGYRARSPVIYFDTSALIKRFVNEKGSLLA